MHAPACGFSMKGPEMTTYQLSLQVVAVLLPGTDPSHHGLTLPSPCLFSPSLTARASSSGTPRSGASCCSCWWYCPFTTASAPCQVRGWHVRSACLHADNTGHAARGMGVDPSNSMHLNGVMLCRHWVTRQQSSSWIRHLVASPDVRLLADRNLSAWCTPSN